MHSDSQAWKLYCRLSFVIAVGMMLMGIWLSPIGLAMQGYFTMGTAFLMGTCFTLAKMLRDDHESSKFHNKIEEAQTERILKEYQRAA
jgi:hypothetical protein